MSRSFSRAIGGTRPGSRCALIAAITLGVCLARPFLAVAGQLTVTNYTNTVAPSSSYPDTGGTELTNGNTAVSTFPAAPSSNLVGWQQTNPNIQFNFTGGQSVSTARVWVAPTSVGVAVYQPTTLTVSAGTYSKTINVPALTNNSLTVAVDITGISAAADQFTVTSTRGGEWTMFSQVQFFGTGAKAANTDALNLATSWTGTQAPVSTDVVLFNTTFSSTTALDTGTAVDWSGLKATGGSGTLTIDPTTSASRLGIGSNGIDLSGTGRSVRLTDLRLTGSTTQPWSIAAGRSLTIGADSLAQDPGASPVLSGSGTLVKEGAATGLTLGSLTSFTGTLSVQAGALATSAANQLTGNYAVSLAAGGTLQLGGNETLPTALNTGLGTIEILQSNTVSIANTSARTVDRVFTGTGVVTKTGTGVLTLSGASSHSGGTSFSTGTIKVASNTALGSGTVTVNGDGSTLGGSLDLNGATVSNVVDLRGSNSGMGNVGSLQNTNTGTAAVLNGGLIVGEDYVGSNGDVVLNGVVSSTASLGSTYSIYKQGAGTWTFANTANTFDGFFYIVGGTTAVTKLANQGQASSLGQPSTSTANRVVFVASSGGVLRFEGSSASISDRGFVLSGGTAATNNVIEAAGTSPAATLTLTGALSAGAAGSYAATLGGTNAGVNVYAGTIGNGSGSLGLVKQGSTTWALTGANSYTGATTVSSGTLKVGNSGTTGTLGGGGVSVAAGATLAFDRSDSSLVVADAISGSGAVIQIGSGTTSLTGANTYTSTTEITAGTLRIGNGNAAGTLGSGGVAIASGVTLAFNRSDSFTVANAISGSGAVVKQAGGTLTLSGTSTYSGGTRLTAGTLIVGSDQALGTGTLAFAAGTLQTARNVLVPIAIESSGTLAIVGSGVNLTANFLGSGTLTKTGTGTLTLSGPSSTFSGNLVIAGGAGANSIVKAGNTSAFGTGTVTILGGGGNTGSTFDLNGQSLDNALVIGLGNSGVNDAGSLMNSNAAVPATLNGAVSLGGEIYVGGAGNIAFTGVVSGTVNPANDYSLYKDGGGTWTFANTANTFDGYYYQVGGVTEVTKLANLNEPSSLGQPTTSGRNKVSFGFGGNGGGTIRFIGSTASTSNREFVMSGGTAASSTVIEAAGDSAAATLTLTGNLSANRAGTYAATLGGTNAGVNVYAGTISNGSATSVALVKDGSTTWALTAANSYTGITTVSAGTLKVGNGGTTGGLGSGNVTTNAALVFDRSNAMTVANAISGTGTVEQAGAGSTALTGNNSYTGTTIVSSGTLAVGGGSTAGTLGSGSVVTNAVLAFNRSDSVTVANAISGTGAVLKQSANTLTLSGSSTYSGGTRLAAGTLIVGSDQALGTGTLSIATAGVTLQTARDVLVPIAVDATSTLSITSTAVNLTANFSGTGTLTKTGTGTLTLSGPASTFSGNLLITGGAGANSVVKAGSTAAFGTGTVTILGSGGNTGSTFDLNGHSLDNALVIGLGNSGVNDAGALMNSNPVVPATLNGAVSLGGEIYVGGAGSITFNGLMSGTVNPANAYSLYKDGAGTWTFANTGNTFDGFYYQFGGVTEVARLANLNEPSSLGQPTTSGRNRVSFGFNGSGGGTIRFIGSAASTSDREFVMAGDTAASSTVIEASGASPVATLTLTGNLSANRAGTYAATLGGTNTGVNVYAGTIGNGSATSVALVKAGSTTWALTAANSYTGSTTISAGTLQIGNGGTVGELGGTGSVSNDGVLAVNRSNAFSFSRAITGSGAFHQLGTGTTTLSGSNTYTGGAAIDGGALALGSAAALGNAGTISFGGGTLQYSVSNTTDYSGRFSNAAGQQYSIDTNGQNVTFGSNLASSGGTLNKLGAGTLTLGGTNAYTGLTTIAAGRLVGSAASLPGAIANAAQLEFAQTSAGTFAAAITGTGSLTKTGTGNLILSGSSSYSGATSVAAGRLSVNGVLGATPVSVQAAAELGGSGSIAGPVSIAAGGSLAPGNSIASLATGTASFAAGATFAYEVDSTDPLSLGSAADLLVVSGNLDLDPGNGTLLTFADIASSPNAFAEDTTIFALVNYSGSWNGGLFTYGSNVLSDGERFSVGSQVWEIDYNRTDATDLDNFTADYLPSSNFVTVTAVPEPATLALAGIGAALVAVAASRRRAA